MLAEASGDSSVAAGNRTVSTSDQREQRHYGIVRIWKSQRGASAGEEGEREALGFHEAKIIAHLADHGTTFTMEFKKLQKRDDTAPVTKQRWIPLALTPFSSAATFASIVTDRPVKEGNLPTEILLEDTDGLHRPP